MPPVEDHPVHPSTRQLLGHRYGCHNHPPYKAGYWAKAGHDINPSTRTATQRVVWVTHSMSMECRFDKSLTDTGCADCCHQGAGEKHAEQLKGRQS